MRFIKTLSLLSLSFLGSQAMKNISSMNLIKDIRIGWNLGNTLDSQCVNYLDYSQDQTASETCWGNPKATEALFKKISSLGFNAFRIPTTWTGHFGSAPQYKISPAWMKRVHEVVDYAIGTGGYAILNLHHETWNYAFLNNLSNAKTILVAIWQQIAKEFANYDEHLIFEGMNEPRKVGSSVEWTGGDQEGWDFVNEMNALFVKTIRASGGNNALRHLMIPTYSASVNNEPVQNFIFPSGDNKLIVSLHSYSPYNFALNTGYGAVSTFTDTSEIDGIMNLIKTTFINKGIPVILGEVGALNRNNEQELVKWAKYFIKSAKSIGVPCVIWDNGNINGYNESYGFIDRSTYNIVFPNFVNGLMSGLGTSSSTNSKNSNVNFNNNVTTKKSSVITYSKVKTTTKAKTTKSKTSKTKTTKTKITTSKTDNTNKTAKTNTSFDYYSCGSTDYQCKQQMYNICAVEASNCWKTSTDYAECNRLNEICSKIWS